MRSVVMSLLLAASAARALPPRLSPALILPSADPITGSPQRIHGAWGSGEYLLVWVDRRNGNRDIYGQRFAEDGTPIGGDLPLVALPSNAGYPAVTFDGQNFLLTWEDDRTGTTSQVHAARVTPTGVVLDPGGIPLYQTTVAERFVTSPACTGSECFVVWSERNGGGAQGWSVFGARLAFDGTVLEYAIPFADSPGGQFFPTLRRTETPSGWFLTWEDNRRDINRLGVFARRYANDFTPLGPTEVEVAPFTQASQNSEPVPLTHVGTSSWLVHTDRVSDGQPSLYLWRFDGTDLAPLPPLRVTTDPLDVRWPVLAHTGDRLFVAYERTTAPSTYRVELQRVTTERQLQDVEPSWTETTAPVSRLPRFIEGPEGNLLFAYVTYDPALPGIPGQVVVHALTSRSVGAACTDAEECSAGFCQRGTCRAGPPEFESYEVGWACDGVPGGAALAPRSLLALRLAPRLRRRRSASRDA